MKSQEMTIEIRKTIFSMMTILCFLAFVAPNVALGITTYWTGASNTDWFVEANWNNGLPSVSDTASIDKTYVNPLKSCIVNAEAGVTGVCNRLTQAGASANNHVFIYSPLHVLNNYICGAYYGYSDMQCFAESSLIVGNDFMIGGAGDGPYWGQGIMTHSGGSVTVGRNLFVGLDGTFQVTTNGVYRPKFGDEWDIIVADADGSGGDALSGSFHTVDFSAIEDIGDFRLRYDTADKKVVLSLYSPGTVFLVR